jgi:Zn-dependent protease
MGGIGLPGGAVYIETWRLRSRGWRTAVSLAGPASNLLLAIILGLILRFSAVDFSGVWSGLAFLALLQVTAVVLNLIPVPPFDGYNAIEPHLNEATRMQFEQTRGAFIWIVFLLLWFVPFVNNAFWNLIFFISRTLGVPLQLAAMGLDQFLFWR